MTLFFFRQFLLRAPPALIGDSVHPIMLLIIMRGFVKGVIDRVLTPRDIRPARERLNFSRELSIGSRHFPYAFPIIIP